jgi:hypothetical protein
VWQSGKVANSTPKPLVFPCFFALSTLPTAHRVGKVANQLGAESCNGQEERCYAGFPQIGNGEPMKIVDLRITG